MPETNSEFTSLQIRNRNAVKKQLSQFLGQIYNEFRKISFKHFFDDFRIHNVQTTKFVNEKIFVIKRIGTFIIKKSETIFG